jgi:predicted nucleotidyltransferase component of viral defense system
MIDIDLHRAVFINVLREIYSDPVLRSCLGFKGGTAAMFFHQLPRFSVDLDFDLLDRDKKSPVLERLKQVLPRFGDLIQAQDKKFTLFFMLSYKKGFRRLKIEISKRPGHAEYISQNHLGISMLVMKKEDMAAGKLSALLTRKRFAPRDVFDLWFFLQDHWEINQKVLREKTDMSLAQALIKAKKKLKGMTGSELLAGLGELLDNKQKSWVKEKLVPETLFQLRLYQDIHRMNRKGALSTKSSPPSNF